MSATAHPEKMVPPSRVRSRFTVGKLNIMRSIWKTLFNFQNRRVFLMTGRHVKQSDFFKYMMWIYLMGYPASLYLGYSSQGQWVQYYADCSERFEHNPKIGGHPVEARRLTQTPHHIYARDPWEHLAVAFEHLRTSPASVRNPKPDDSWAAWGEPALNYAWEGTRNRTLQNPNAFMLARHNAEGNFLTYYVSSCLDGFVQSWQAAYYRYYHVFFNVPLEERFESLGAQHPLSRRIMHHLWQEGGPGGWRYITPASGFERPWQSHTAIA